MGHVFHALARTTPEVRRKIQNSQECLISLSQRYGVNHKTAGRSLYGIPTLQMAKCSRDTGEKCGGRRFHLYLKKI